MLAARSAIGQFCDFIMLLIGCVGNEDIERFVFCWALYKWGNLFPMLPRRLAGALARGTIDDED
eukprot:6200954-Pyramimonas_sp.AAC.1